MLDLNFTPPQMYINMKHNTHFNIWVILSFC